MVYILIKYVAWSKDGIRGMVTHPYPSHNTNPGNGYSNPHENGLMTIPICGDHGTYGFKEVLMIDGQGNASEVTQAQVLVCQKNLRIKTPLETTII